MPVIGPKTTQRELDEINLALLENREHRYSPEKLAEMEKLLDTGESRETHHIVPNVIKD